MRRIGVAVLALAALAASALAAAGTASGSFGVRIALNLSAAASEAPATGTCISESLGAATGAVVRVACASGQFVSISPRYGRRFLGTHGGAYGYYFRPAQGVIFEPLASAGGSGSITSFRVYGIEEADGPLHMLVSF